MALYCGRRGAYCNLAAVNVVLHKVQDAVKAPREVLVQPSRRDKRAAVATPLRTLRTMRRDKVRFLLMFSASVLLLAYDSG
jgi:hypothetical protein